MNALVGEASLFILGYEQYDRLIEGTRTIHSGLRVQFPRGAKLYNDRCMSGYRLTQK